MTDPLLALLVGGGVLILAALVMWPQSGIVSRLRQRRQLTEKVLMEDALKYIFNCERNHLTATLDGVAASLGTSPGRTSEILALTQSNGLVTLSENKFSLTEEGTRAATQIVRAHRLWERYLADATGYEEGEWHQQAERQEHLLSPGEIDRLSARLGNPSHDPHGDPIPTRRGDFVDHGGIPLSDLDLAVPAKIVHIEDEPDVIYAQIVAENLYPRMVVEVDEKSANRIRFWTGDVEHVLAPVVAANISVLPLADDGPDDQLSGVGLDTLQPGESGTVTGISALSRGVERRRLLDLGIIPGTEIGVELVNPGGDPTAYRIRGSVIALRKRQARLIQVQRVNNGKN